MTTTLRSRPRRRAAALPATALAAALAAGGLGAAVAVPAHAADYISPVDPNVAYSVPTEVELGQPIQLSGSGWTSADGSAGSVIAVKLDDGAVSTTEDVVNPVTGQVEANKTIYAIAQADADGDWTAEVAFPTAENSDASWAVGETHSVRLLTGSLLPGDQARSLGAEFTVVEDTDEPGEPGEPGEFEFDVSSVDLGTGQYQIAYSARNDDFWVTQAGPPPVTTSRLLRVDPEALEIVNDYRVPFDEPSQTVEAVFGLDVDDDHDTVWTTSTRLNRVAVYSQETGEHLRTFDDVNHGREVEVDEANNTVYVSAVNGSYVATFDTETLERGPDIAIEGQPMGLDLDAENGIVYTSTLDTNRLAAIDTATGEVTYHDLPGAARSSNVAVAPELGRVYAANQDSADVTVLDAATGEHVASIPTGAGALALDVDEENGLLYVANFFAHTVSIVDTASNEVVHTVEGVATHPNHVLVHDGSAYVVDRATFGGAAIDHLVRITPTSVPGEPGEPGEPSEGGITITATVPDDSDPGEPGTGSLRLTVTSDAPVVLQQQPDQGDRLAFAGELPVVRVTDNRSDEQAAGGGWALSGRAGDFTAPGGGGFGAGHLGWTPRLPAPKPGLDAGAAVAGLLDDGPGLAAAASLATADAEARTGTTDVTAGLALAVPVDTAPGAYSSTLTVSLFPTD